MVGIQLVAFPLRVRTRLAERRAGDHHELRIEPGQRGVVEPSLLQLPRARIVDQHVGLAQQIEQPLPVICDVHIERDTALVRVEKERFRSSEVASVARKWTPAARRVARAARLHLDDGSPVVGEDPAAIRSGNALRQLG